jgi:magnesium transporter
MVTTEPLTRAELRDAWPVLSLRERLEGFALLGRADGEDLFVSLDSHDQLELLAEMEAHEQRSWVRLLAPDDAADLVQQAADVETRDRLLGMLDSPTRSQVTALLAYAEDAAGGLMNPRFYRLRPDMSVDEAIAYLRRQIGEPIVAVHFAYVLDPQQRLLGVVPFRDLICAAPDKRVAEVMNTGLVTVPEDVDQEKISRIFARHDLFALPVLDAEGRMKGIITADDILDVVNAEHTEDFHKLGGMAALAKPYLQIGVPAMVRKRVGWLAVLFIGESFTATAMAFFEQELARAVVLSLFIPLIVSSGGNSGSQASTLIIRAMALGHVRLRDWFRVARREVITGLVLGAVLAAIALVRILAWEYVYRAARHTPLYGEHYVLVAVTVAASLVGVVMWGSLAGCMLPFLLRALRRDPASASAPFIATLVDVSGLVIYLSVASIVLRGTLL